MIAIPATTAPATFDPTDVPRVDAAHLARMLDLLVSGGHGLMMLRGADATALAALEAAFWRGFSGDTATGVSTLVRFRAVLEAFASRRLRSLLMRDGYAVLKAAFQAAAETRLNASRGFNPQGLVWSVTAELASARRRAAPVHGYATQIAA